MSTAYMKCRTLELEIPEGNPFQNDKLDRSHLGNILTDIVKFYGQSGCVMALNGEWGAGKLHLSKCGDKNLKTMVSKLCISMLGQRIFGRRLNVHRI